MMVSLPLFVLFVMAWLAVVWVFVGEFGVAFWLLGLLIYMAAPIVVGRVRTSAKLGRHYINSGFRMLGRGLFVAHNNGGFSVIRSRSDPDYKTFETGIVNGRRGYWEDPLNAMSSIGKASVGIVSDKYGAVVDLTLAEIGQRDDAMVAAGEHERYRSGERQFAKYVALTKAMSPVDPRAVGNLISGWADPFSVEEGEQYGKNSYELLKQNFSRGQVIAFIITYAAGAGITFLVVKYGGGTDGGGGSGGGGTLPIMLDAISQVPGLVT